MQIHQIPGTFFFFSLDNYIFNSSYSHTRARASRNCFWLQIITNKFSTIQLNTQHDSLKQRKGQVLRQMQLLLRYSNRQPTVMIYEVMIIFVEERGNSETNADRRSGSRAPIGWRSARGCVELWRHASPSLKSSQPSVARRTSNRMHAVFFVFRLQSFRFRIEISTIRTSIADTLTRCRRRRFFSENRWRGGDVRFYRPVSQCTSVIAAVRSSLSDIFFAATRPSSMIVCNEKKDVSPSYESASFLRTIDSMRSSGDG